MTAPDVSVIMPAWKAGGFIGDAIASALASTGVSVEVVAVDDASPDDTYATLQALAAGDARIVIDRLSANAGPSAARNRAIALSKGRYIAVLDADDSLAPDRLARLVAALDSSGADIAADNMIEVDEAGQRLNDHYFLRSQPFASACVIDLTTWVNFNQPMKPIDCLGYLKPVIRRATLDRLNQRYDERLRNSEDYYLIADLLASGARMTYLPDAGYRYRRATSSISHRLKPSDTAAWRAAEVDYRARHPSLGAREVQALDARARLLRDIDHFVNAVELAKQKKLPQLAGHFAADPRGSLYTLSAFARIAKAKALGGSAF